MKEPDVRTSIQNDELRSYCLQDKRSRFVVIDNQDYIEMIDYQLGRSSFEKLDHDPSEFFSKKVNSQIQQWTENKVLDKSCSKFIEPLFVAPEKTYGFVKTHKLDNPARAITNGVEQLWRIYPFLLKRVYFQGS